MTVAENTPPAGYHTVTPYLMVAGVDGLIDFLERAFGAQVTERMVRADGSIGHAEVRLGDSVIMLGEAGGNWPAAPATLHLYVDDADAAYRQALAAQATSVMEPADQFYGDRMAGVTDAWGNTWWLATRVEEVPREEMEKRAADAWQAA